MLAILLCIFFPPAIPFVIIWRMGRGRKTQKAQLAATRDLLAITAVPVEMRGAVLHRRNVAHGNARMIKLLVFIVVIGAIAMMIASH